MAFRLTARVLRAVADRIDPPKREQPKYAAPRGMYVLDFTRGEVWLDGEIVSRGSTHG